MGRVEHIFVSVGHRLPMREVAEGKALAEKGFQGCAHARPGMRQLLLVESEVLEALELTPGSIMENITTRGIELAGLRPGQRLQVGEAVLEITLPCAPCERMDAIRQGLKEALRGRRGMLCRVVETGRIRAGDAIALQAEEQVAN
jgi:MOSC domain-containing protein YiiM